jgi:hypothetical protein
VIVRGWSSTPVLPRTVSGLAIVVPLRSACGGAALLFSSRFCAAQIGSCELHIEDGHGFFSGGLQLNELPHASFHVTEPDDLLSVES